VNLAHQLRHLFTLLSFHNAPRWLDLLDLTMLDQPQLQEASLRALSRLDELVVGDREDSSIGDEDILMVVASFLSDLGLDEVDRGYVMRYVTTQLNKGGLDWTLQSNWTRLLWHVRYQADPTQPDVLAPQQRVALREAIGSEMPRDRWGAVFVDFEDELTAEESQIHEHGGIQFEQLVWRRGFERTWERVVAVLPEAEVDELRRWAEVHDDQAGLTVRYYFGGRLPHPSEELDLLNGR